MADESDTIRIRFGGPQDVPELAALAREHLPTFPALHDEAGWSQFNRFGDARTMRGALLSVLLDGDDGPLIGFIWADSAPAFDWQIVEPWWCLNAVAIDPRYRRQGVASGLVSSVVMATRALGVELIYGLAAPGTASFWESMGFAVGGDSERLRSSGPALMESGERRDVQATPQDDHRFFVGYLTGDPISTDSALVLESRLSPMIDDSTQETSRP